LFAYNRAAAASRTAAGLIAAFIGPERDDLLTNSPEPSDMAIALPTAAADARA
jgi:hypothetical protein